MEKEELYEIIKRYQNGEASDYDNALLESWYLNYNEDKPMEVNLADRLYDLHQVKSKLDLLYQQASPKMWPRMVVAASLIFTIGFSIYYYNNPSKITKEYHSSYANDIPPGSNKAILTLSNGKKINLSAIENGEIAASAGIKITKATSGELVYTNSGTHSSAMEYNTIEIPKGGKYQLLLADGTKVWLNAASSLKYPTSFLSLKERKVKLSGEAYFEVAPNKATPFKVETIKQVVEVLGTHFNINSYLEEKMVKTTLLQGSISINQKVILKPGEQATNCGQSICINPVDTSTVVDWKNGDFSFNKGDDFKSDMREIARWYDVEIVYNSSVTPKMDLGGWVSRKNNLSTILNRIQSTGKVHFKIDGRRVMVIN